MSKQRTNRWSHCTGRLEALQLCSASKTSLNSRPIPLCPSTLLFHRPHHSCPNQPPQPPPLQPIGSCKSPVNHSCVRCRSFSHYFNRLQPAPPPAQPECRLAA